MPEVASLPLHLTVTGWLYQPLESGLREKLAATFGAVASILIGAVTSVVELPSWLVAVQLCVVPVVGPGTATAARQVVALIEPDTAQWRTTPSPYALPWYQPLVPEIPSIEYVIVGGDAAAGATKRSKSASPTAAAAVKRDIATAP